MFAERTLSRQKPVYDAGRLRLIKTNALFYPSIALVLLSIIAFAVNDFIYQYPGNLYLPTGGFYVPSVGFYEPSGYLLLCLILPLMYAGFFLLHGADGKMTQIIKEWIYFFLILVLFVVAANAMQYTPFTTIDRSILKFESLLHIDTHAIIRWTHAHPLFKSALAFIYNSLPYQMCYIPLIVIVAGRKHLIREYYFLLITTAVTGFTFYYFFPTTAPASVVNSLYFSESQRSTGLKFYQLHHYIQPSTLDGGLIALPSFHVIWAWLCLYLLRGWPVAFFTLLPINALLTVSCVLLGWHYCTDIVGGVVVILLAHFLFDVSLKKSLD